MLTEHTVNMSVPNWNWEHPG